MKLFNGIILPTVKSRLLAVLIIGLIAGGFIKSSVGIIKNYPPVDGFVLSNGLLLGGDFIGFYAPGKMGTDHRELLYDFNFQKDFRNRILGQAASALKGELPFVHPPLVAWAFSWLGSLSFEKAFYSWLAISLIISVGSLLLLAHELRILNARNIPFLLLGIFGFAPYYIECLMGGQLSSVGIFIYSLLFILLRRKKDFLAGLISCLGYYKPAYFVLAVIALILARGKVYFSGFLLGCLALIMLTISYIGLPALGSYLTMVSHYRYGQEIMESVKLPLQHGVGLYPVFTIFHSPPWPELVYLVLFIVILKAAIKNLKDASGADSQFFGLAYVFTVVSSLALSLQFAKYDLSILLVTFIILAAQFPLLKKYTKWIGITIAGFYLESALRERAIGVFGLNVTSFIFIPYLMLIYSVIRADKIPVRVERPVEHARK
jgi:hypothetical protein